MAWLLRLLRSRPGRHELGVAVVSLPSPPVRPPLAAPVVHVPAARVELGFRDGSTATLVPGSAQARALEEIAVVLTHRD